MSTLMPKVFSGIQAFTPFAAGAYLSQPRPAPALQAELDAIARVLPHAADDALREEFATVHAQLKELLQHRRVDYHTVQHSITSSLVPLLERVPERSWQAMGQAHHEASRAKATFRPSTPPKLIVPNGSMGRTTFVVEAGPKVILTSLQEKTWEDDVRTQKPLYLSKRETLTPLHQKAQKIISDVLHLYNIFQIAGSGDVIPGFTDAGLLATPRIEVTLREVAPDEKTGLRVQWHQGKHGVKLEIDARRDCLKSTTSGMYAAALLHAICRSCATASDIFLRADDFRHGRPQGLLKYDPDIKRLREREDLYQYQEIAARMRQARQHPEIMHRMLERMILPDDLKKQMLKKLPCLEISPILILQQGYLDVPRISLQHQPARKDLPKKDRRQQDTLLLRLLIHKDVSRQHYPDDFFLQASLHAIAVWIAQGKPSSLPPTKLWSKPYPSSSTRDTKAPSKHEKRLGNNELPTLAWLRALREKALFRPSLDTPPDEIRWRAAHQETLNSRYPGLAELFSLHSYYAKMKISDVISPLLKDISFRDTMDSPLEMPAISFQEIDTNGRPPYHGSIPVLNTLWQISVTGASYMVGLVDTLDFFESALVRINDLRFHKTSITPFRPISFAPKIVREDTALAWAWVRLYHAYELLGSDSEKRATSLQIKIVKQRGRQAPEWIDPLKQALGLLKKSELQDAPFTWLIDSAHISEHIEIKGQVVGMDVKRAHKVSVLVGERARLICFSGNPVLPQASWNQLIKAIAQLPEGPAEIEVLPSFRVIGATLTSQQDQYERNPEYRKAPPFLRHEYRHALTAINLEARGAGLETLTPTSAPADVKKLYRALAIRLHPDKHQGEGDGRFRMLQEAYDVIRSFHPE